MLSTGVASMGAAFVMVASTNPMKKSKIFFITLFV
jgi:hypothetical protein